MSSNQQHERGKRRFITRIRQVRRQCFLLTSDVEHKQAGVIVP